MNAFYRDILEQPHALRDLTGFYRANAGVLPQVSFSSAQRTLLTGMGASYHAAWIATQHLYQHGIPAVLLEASDLLLAKGLLNGDTPLVYVSQSGSSAEVEPILAQRPANLIALTNEISSPLAQSARVTLPLRAGQEEFVATKTYTNSLAVLWLLVRAYTSSLTGSSFDTLQQLADQAETLVTASEAISARWLETFQDASRLIFLGAGPHAATARQAAMMVAEWVKLPALSYSAGAFRHGFIESVEPDMGIVIFASRGAASATAIALAQELSDYGAHVLLVSRGRTYTPQEKLPTTRNTDEFLAPILDIIPVQLFTEALARARGVAPGFRYIGKIITKL